MTKKIFLATGLMLCLLGLWFGQWKISPTHADAWGYYAYLPSAFIFHDLSTLDSMAAVRTQVHPGSMGFGQNPLGIMEVNQTATGRYCIKYTMGVAILQAPFFAVGHLVAKMLDFPEHGLSLPYLFALLCSAIFWPLLGLWFLRKTLLKYFSPATVWLVLAGLLFGTNLLYFSTVNLMSHAYLFGLWCLLIWATDAWYADEKSRSGLLSVAIGALAGLIALIRPVEIICVAVPLFWGVHRWSDLVLRGRLFWQHGRAILLAIAAFGLVWMPQMMYWKWVSGEWLHDSYPNEHFTFLEPHLLAGIFGFKNGWLVFTPIMFLALAGLFVLRRYAPKAALPLAIILPVYLWIIYSWWCWTWVNGFGSRPMVEIYPLLAFPLAALLERSGRGKLLFLAKMGVVGFFIWLNTLQTWQMCNGLIWSQDMNLYGWLTSIGQTKFSKRMQVALETNLMPPPKGLQPESTVYFENFETSVDSNFSSTVAFSGRYSYLLTPEYSPGLDKTAQQLGLKPGDWLRASVHVFVPGEFLTCAPGETSGLVINMLGKTNVWEKIQLQNKMGNPDGVFFCGETGFWDEAAFFIQVPDDFPANGAIKLYAWHPFNSPKKVFLDDLKLERWR